MDQSPLISIRLDASTTSTPLHPSREPPTLTVPLVRRLGEQRNTAALLWALGSDQAKDNLRLRRVILNKLMNIGDPTSIPSLTDVVHHDPDRTAKALAMNTLCNIGDRNSVTFLAEMLRNADDANLRVHAAGGLGNTRANEAVAPLIEALKDRRSAVRAVAAKSLAEIGDRSAVAPIEAALRRTWHPLWRMGMKVSLNQLR
jgi:HEAT repeat protein